MAAEALMAGLWARRGRVLLLALMLYAAGAATVLAWPRAYLAEAVVAPSETTGIATSSLLAPALSLGAMLDTRPSGNFAIYLASLRSPEAARMLAEETGLLAWLAEERRRGPGGLLRALLGATEPPDADHLRSWLERRFAATQSIGQVTWTLSLSHPERAAALDALRRLHGFAEAKVRADLEEMARRRVAALEARLAREPDLYIRQSLYEVLAQQQRAGVVVAADEAVAARLVSGPVVEARPSLPNRSLLLALLMPAAGMAALAVAAAAVLLAGGPPRPPRLLAEPAE